LLSQYTRFHLLRLFFEDLPAWKENCRLAGTRSTLTQFEYDRLFKGTDANIYIPLWASACISGMDILLNEDTLAVITFYKTRGYVTVGMDGNPSDFVGEQFRFLEYLTRCALSGEEEFAGDAQDFIDRFTLDTVRAIGKALRLATGHPEVLEVLRLAEETLRGAGREILPSEAQLAAFDSWGWKRRPPIPLEDERTVSSASFNDCGGRCKMLSRVREGCVLAIGPDSGAPVYFSGCPRGAAYRQTFLNARRLRYPMERVGRRGEGLFRRISWEEAADKVAAAIRCSEAEGPGSRYVMAGAGVVCPMRGSDMLRRLLALNGGYLGYYSTYSIGGALAVLPRMFGELVIGSHEEEILNAKLLLLWGNNLVTNHFGSAQKRMLMEAKRRGTRIIVVDPRRSDTAVAAADKWIAIRPGTDSALAAAMCFVIREKKLCDKEFMDKFCLGFDEAHMPEGVPAGESFFSYLSGVRDGVEKTPAWAEKITGVPAADIEELAVEYAGAKYALLLPGLGPQRTVNGEQNYRSILTLACMTGGFGKPGGGVVTWTRPSIPRPAITPIDNPYKVSIAVFQWWRALACPETLDAGRGLIGARKLDAKVRLIFSLASGMLLNQHSDINHTLQILRDSEQENLIVLSDLFMTPSAKGADLVLPAPSFFETDNLCAPWGGEDYMLFNHAAIPPLFGSRLELDWLVEVARRLGLEEAFCAGNRTLDDWLRGAWDNFRALMPDAPDYDAFKEKSIAAFETRLPRNAFQENFDKGTPFKTPSGKIEIFIKELYDRQLPEVPAIPAYVPAEEGSEDPLRAVYPLQLIGFHSKRRCHSIHDKNAWLDELEPPRLWLHTADAAARGISDGDAVEVYNARGRMRIPAFVTDRIARGVVAASPGAWYTPDKEGVETRGSINVLTMSHRATPLGNANPQHTNLVEVKKA
ncbi:MAG TPA: molybdopterin-dependent oxidoreductase, partial [Terriglobales bacterium]|nr:molybdopterin-dependent oxidoreductase [Terriglobales bacterium]